MLTLIFIVFMFIVFGKILSLALKGAWGLTKILFTLVFFPIIVIGLGLSGLVVVAIPLLLIGGVAAMISAA
jgi:hypothetical protein